MSLSKLWSSFLFQITVVLASAYFVFVRYSETLPTVMQDEYVYLVQAVLRPISENEFGNFLHSFVYSNVTAFGDDFYLATKVINTIFLVLFVLSVLVTSRKYLPSWAGAPMGILTTLGATSLYSSVFMPETMFFALAGWAVALFTFGWESKGGRKIAWFSAAITLAALAGLTKPHALFLVFGVLAFVILMMFLKRISIREGGLLALAFIGGYVGLKLGLGYILAGPAGLSILGPAYESSLSTFIFGLQAFNSGAMTASAGAINPASTQGAASFFAFILIQILILTIAFSFMTMGLPAFLVRPLNKLTDFQLLTITVTLVYVVAVAGFTAFVSFTGDDHSNRILGRYFEFLIPFVLISSLVEIEKRVPIFGPRRVALVASIPVLAVAWWLTAGRAQLMLADSAVLLGSFRTQLLPWLVIAAFSMVLFVAIDRSKHLTAIAISSVLLASTVIGLSAQQRQIELNTGKYAADLAGDSLRGDFSEVPGEEIVIAGTIQKFALVTKFWSLKANVEDVILPTDTVISAEDPRLAGYSLIVQLPGISVSDARILLEGDGYKILEPFTP